MEETGEFFVHCETPGVPCDRTNLCVQAFEALRPADGLTFHIRSEIPVGAGLGSSAAATVAGLAAADHMYELDAPVFELARELEGHPDNAAAALLGGFVICDAEGVTRLDPPPGLEGLLAIPPDAVPTVEARAAMPAEVPIADAVHNVAHASLLVLGLARDDFSLIGRGLADRIHQPRRAALYPRSMELLERAADLGAVGASISGAGPERAVLGPLATDRSPDGGAPSRGARLRDPPGPVHPRRRGRQRALTAAPRPPGRGSCQRNIPCTRALRARASCFAATAGEAEACTRSANPQAARLERVFSGERVRGSRACTRQRQGRLTLLAS